MAHRAEKDLSSKLIGSKNLPGGQPNIAQNLQRVRQHRQEAEKKRRILNQQRPATSTSMQSRKITKSGQVALSRHPGVLPDTLAQQIKPGLLNRPHTAGSKIEGPIEIFEERPVVSHRAMVASGSGQGEETIEISEINESQTEEHKRVKKMINEEKQTKKYSKMLNQFVQLLKTSDGEGQEEFKTTTETINKTGFGLGKPSHISCQDVLDRIKILRNPTFQKLNQYLELDPRNEEYLLIYLEQLFKNSHKI